MPLAPVFAQEASDTPATPAVTSDSSTTSPDSPADDSSQTSSPAPDVSLPSDMQSQSDSSPSPDANSDQSQASTPDANSADSNANKNQTQSLLTPGGVTFFPSPSVLSPSVFTTQTAAPKVDTVSGALTQQIPLDIPPGRNGLQPNLELDYNSQNVDLGSEVGYGWSLSIPYIQRENKLGTDQLYSSNYFTSSLQGELIGATSTGTTTPTTFYARVDDGSFNKYLFSNNAWTVYDKNGVRYDFGTTTQAQQFDATSTSQIYKWMLEKVTDTNGNTIQYTYVKDSDQIYPSQITYTGTATTTGSMSITFATSTRPDNTTSYLPTFGVTTNYRISEIDAKVNGSLVRKYVLSYGTGNNTGRSLLTGVQETGQDANGNQLTLPAMTFSYKSDTSSFVAANQSGNCSGDPWIAADATGAGRNDSTLSFWNGNSGTPGMNVYPGGSSLSGATPTPPASNVYWDEQVSGSLATTNCPVETGTRFVSVTGNGKADIVQGFYNSQTGTTTSIIYPNTSSVGSYSWGGSTAFNGVVPSFQVLNPNTSSYTTGLLGDVNGDGLPDYVYNAGGTNQIYLGNGSAWNSPTTTIFSAPNSFPTSGSDCTNSQLVDINGDGLPDWVYTDGTNTYVKLNTGTGWASSPDSRWTFATSTVFSSGGNCYDRGMRFVDVNGDGLPDFIRSYSMPAGNGDGLPEIGSFQFVYLNTGSGWATSTAYSLPTIVQGFVVTCCSSSHTVYTELANFNGNGQQYQDVLATITYPKGGSSAITYGYSAQTGNNPQLPISLLTVTKVVTSDNNGNSSETDYSYSGGLQFYNSAFPQDRKFAGFYTITETHPDYIVKTYFNQGDGTTTTSSTDGELTDAYAQIGDPFRIDVKNTSGTLVRKTLNTWNSTSQGSTTFNTLGEQTVQDFASDGTHQDKITDYTYSPANGDLLQTDVYDVTNTNHRLRTSYSYATNSAINLDVLTEKQTLDTTLVSTSTNATGTIRYLITGGGGGGGSGFFFGQGGGGGGAGGLLSGTTTVSSQAYTITVGTGGSGGAASTGSSNFGSNGADSVAFSQDAVGGGGGAAGGGQTGSSGGSGGGSNYNGTAEGPSGSTAGQGNGGGRANFAANGTGGGGFSSQGQWTSTTNNNGTDGGTGTTSAITGSVLAYAGGGGGGSTSSGTGGNGQAGGGNGGSWNGSVPTNGLAATTTNTGSGGGGGGGGQVSGSLGTAGGNGADGVVIISSPAGTIPTATGGVKTTIGGNDIWTFTTSGSWIIPTTTIVAQNITLADEQYYYDNLGFGSVSTGNQTKVADWVSGTTYASTTKGYNSYGLVASSTDPDGNKTTYSYDSFNFYPATSTNVLNQSTSYVYDYATGKVATTTDPNGLTNVTVYDPVGRVVQQKEPDPANASSIVLRKSIAYTDSGFPTYTTTTNYLSSASSTTAYEYFDGLGRTIQTRTQAAPTNTYSVMDKVYGTDGLLLKASLPYFASSTSWGSSTTTPSLFNSFTYDPLQRTLTSVNAVGTTTYVYSSRHTSVTDPNGNLKDLYNDMFGNLVNVVEHVVATSSATTTYAYDFKNNLTKVTDASGNIRNFTYDGLNRRLTAEDLHAVGDATFGTTTYAYDLAGNLTQKVDPKLQTVNYTYDALNRPLTEDYTGQSGTEMSYTYDSCTNGIGQLCSVTTTANSTSYTYNPLGMKNSENETIVGTSTSFATQYAYDRQGNQTYVTYPDNAQVQYTFNPAGQIDSVFEKESGTTTASSTIVSHFSYAPTGDIASVQYGNGTVTTNTYNPAALYRLSSKVTTLPSSSHAQDLTYSYDALGNITQIVDASNSATTKTVGYAYDGLSRLLTASTTNAATGPNYTYNYTYDALGNITNGPLGTYSYTGSTGFNYANPDALTILGVATSTGGGTISTSTIAFDATSTSISIGTTGTTTKTWTHTVTGSSPVIVLTADLIQTVAGVGTVGSVSWNGAAFTKATTTQQSNTDAEIWYLVASTTGAKTMSVTINGSTDAIRLAASSFTGVSTSSTLDLSKTAKGSGGNPTISITPTTNTDVVISTLSKTGGGAGSGGGSSGTTTPTLVQSGVNHSSAVTLGSAVSTGDAIVVGVTNFGAVSTVTDNKGNTYTKVADAKNGTDHAAIYYAKNVTGGSTFTITSNAGGTIAAHEYSGIATSTPLDKTASSTGTGTVLSSGTVTVGNDHEVYFAVGWSDNSGDTWTAGSGYTLRQQETDNNTWERLATEDAILSSASTSVARFTVTTSDSWAAAIATFKPSTTGGGGGTATTSADATSSQTVLYKDVATSTFGGASYKIATTSGTITDTYTTATSTNWAMASIALRPATTTTGGGGVTSTSTLTYDKNGNLTSDGTYTYSWDYRNRLATTTNSGTSTYAYDQNNNRVKLVENGVTTFSPNTLYNLTSATTTKNIYANGLLLATVEGTASSTTTTSGGGGGGTSTSTPAFVQGAMNSSTGAVTASSAVTTGNTVIVGLTIWNTSIPSNAISDNKGNTYTKIGETINAGSTDHAALFYARNVTGGSSFTVTSSIGGTVAMMEYSGLATSTASLDQLASSTGTTGNLSSGNVTTSTGNELYVGLGWSNGNGDTWTAGGGYTLREQETNNNTAERIATEDQVISSATTTAALFAVPTNNYWIALLASFKPSTSGSSGGGGTGTTTTTSASTTIRYIATDNLGGTNIVTDQSGSVISEALDYYPYGGIRVDSKTNYGGSKFKYAQTQYDAASTLNYAQNRYENSSRGQFISEDPVFLSTDQNIQDPQSLNAYSYAEDNPIVKEDPLGKFAIGFGLGTEGNTPGLFASASNIWVLTVGTHPFQIEVGSLTSGEGGGTTAVVGGSAALQFMYSQNAQNINDLEGPAAVVGGSGKLGLDLGFELGLSRDPNNPNKKIIDTETASVGIGGVVTPYELPVEFHGGGGYSAAGYTANLTNNFASMVNAFRSGGGNINQLSSSVVSYANTSGANLNSASFAAALKAINTYNSSLNAGPTSQSTPSMVK
jgi:RHS repeat-associated protein